MNSGVVFAPTMSFNKPADVQSAQTPEALFKTEGAFDCYYYPHARTSSVLFGVIVTGLVLSLLAQSEILDIFAAVWTGVTMAAIAYVATSMREKSRKVTVYETHFDYLGRTYRFDHMTVIHWLDHDDTVFMRFFYGNTELRFNLARMENGDLFRNVLKAQDALRCNIA